jgi:hypothetical protein
MTRDFDSKSSRVGGADSQAGLADGEHRGRDDAARRERMIDDSIESVVAALKRVHRASQMVAGIGAGNEPATTRSLLYDLVDTNARYLRNMLGIAARANDQIADLFGQSYGAGYGRLKEKSIEVTLARVEKEPVATGTFRLHNATSCAVTVVFPAHATFTKVGDPKTKHEDVRLGFFVNIPDGSRRAEAKPGAEVACSTVPADGVLEVTVALVMEWAGDDRWSAETVIHTNAAHDLGLVLEIGPP